MFNVLIRGFETEEQAREFINWYECQGEQYPDIWFQEKGIPIPGSVDTKKTFPIKVHREPEYDYATFIMELRTSEWDK